MASKPDTRIIRALATRKKPNLEEAATHQRAGQNAYKEGDLQGAIRSFTQVRPVFCVSSQFRLTTYISRLWQQTLMMLAFMTTVPPLTAS